MQLLTRVGKKLGSKRELSVNKYEFIPISFHSHFYWLLMP